MSKHSLTTHHILEGVFLKGARSQTGKYRTVREKEENCAVDLRSVRRACAAGRAKKITLPTSPFNHKDDEA